MSEMIPRKTQNFKVHRDVLEMQQVLTRYCRALTGSTWDGDDLAQDTLLKVLTSGRTELTSVPRPFLFRVAKNAWIDRCRKTNVSRGFVDRDVVGDPDVQDRLAVFEAMSLLTNELTGLQQAVFMLRDVFAYSTRETAALLHTSEGAVKATLHRARQTVKEMHKRDEAAQSAQTPDLQKDLVKAYVAALVQSDARGIVSLALADVLEPVQAMRLVIGERGRTPHKVQAHSRSCQMVA